MPSSFPFPFPDALTVPLFPLPGVALFPGCVMPLRVFEPRYLKMLEDAMAAERLIGMAHLKDPADLPPGTLITTLPPIHDVMGVGTVVAHEPQDDGTINIAVLGQARVRLVEELPHQPYRIARVEKLGDQIPRTPELRRHLDSSRDEMLLAAWSLIGRTLEGDAAKQLESVLRDNPEPGAASDLLASVYVHHPGLKQALLENVDVLKRTHLITSVLGKLLLALEPKPPATPYGAKDYSLN